MRFSSISSVRNALVKLESASAQVLVVCSQTWFTNDVRTFSDVVTIASWLLAATSCLAGLSGESLWPISDWIGCGVIGVVDMVLRKPLPYADAKPSQPMRGSGSRFRTSQREALILLTGVVCV